MWPFLSIIVGIAVITAFLRWREIRSDPSGIGYNAKVAHGRYQVFATTMHHRSFWGGYRVFYRFEVIDDSGRQIVFEEVPVRSGVAPLELVDSRILWSEAHSRVRVVCNEVEVWQFHIPQPQGA